RRRRRQGPHRPPRPGRLQDAAHRQRRPAHRLRGDSSLVERRATTRRRPGTSNTAWYHARMRFQGTDTYVADDELKLAVNATIALERPLLVKGEPGTGKTMLAEEVARSLAKPLFQWHIKSTTKAQQGLYEYDAVSRLRDSQLGQEKVHDIANYIVK